MPTHYGHFSDVPEGAWRWPDFRPAEIASHGDGSLLVDERALDALQRARNLLGRPLVVNSGYRDPIYNARVGGAPLSEHKRGRAFDLALRGHDRAALLAACRAAGFTGFGYYRTFLHVDTGRPRFWYGNGGERAWSGLATSPA